MKGNPGALAIQMREREIARLLLQGKDRSFIAAKLGLAFETVIKYEQKLADRWIEKWIVESNEDYRRKLAADLERLHEIEAEARQAWKRSQKNAEVKRQTLVRKKVNDDGDLFADDPDQAPMVVIREENEVRGQVGDPRFLAEIRSCIQMRLQVMGAFKDTTVNLLAGAITPDQMMAFVRTLMRGAEEIGIDANELQQLRERTLGLLPAQVADQIAEDIEPEEPLNGQSNGEQI